MKSPAFGSEPCPSDSVGFELTFWIEPRHREEFLQTAESLSTEVSPRPGCFEKVGKESRFLWRECWETRIAFEERLSSPEVRTLLGAIEVLGRLESLQEIELHGRSQIGLGRLP